MQSMPEGQGIIRNQRKLSASQIVFLTLNTALLVVMTLSFVRFWYTWQFWVWLVIAPSYGIWPKIDPPRTWSSMVFRFIAMIGIVILFRTLVPERFFEFN